MTKRKDERRELLKEDEFLSIMERAVQYGKQNQSRVWGVGGAILLLLVVVFGSQYYTESTKNKTAAALYKAEKILNINGLSASANAPKFDTEKERYEKALTELETVLGGAKGDVYDRALVYKIRCLVSLGRQDEVKPLYEELTKRGETVRFIGMMGLGDIHFEAERYDEAVTQYQQILGGGKNSENYEALAKYKIALCHREKGEVDKAVGELETIVSRYEDETEALKPPVFTKAKSLLDELKADKDAATS